MFRPRRLGCGVVYSSYVLELLAREPGLVDFVEIEPETLWVQSAPGRLEFRLAQAELERLCALPCSKVLHSIGFPVGGSCPPDLAHVALLNRMADALDSPWVSEHLSFNTCRVAGEITRTGMLLPPLQTAEGVDCAVRSALAYAAALNRPLAVETGVNYLRRRAFELSDGEFTRRVVEGADCGILLDLHNLFANERNGRQRVLDVVAELPLDRVWEVHVAGGEERKGYWIDSHCGAVPEEVYDLAREVLPRLSNVSALTLEIFPAYLPQLGPHGLRREIDRMREIFGMAKQSVPGRLARPATVPAEDAPCAASWERALAEGILRRPATTSAQLSFADDAAMSLYGELLEEFRASMIGTALGLTTRLLLLHLGDTGMRGLLSSFWRQNPPEMSAAAEAVRFCEFLLNVKPDIPLLQEIVSFELAAVRAIMEQSPHRVALDCDIRLAISDLVQRRRPERPGPTRFEFIIDPPAGGAGHAVRGANSS